MGWQTTIAVQLQAGNTIINPNGSFTYSSAPAAGNLIASTAPASGTDSFGNHYLQGVAAYGATFAASLNGGFMTLYTGSLSGGWSAGAEIETSASGDILLIPSTGRQVTTSNNTLDDGSGNMTVAGTLSVGGSTNTGACNSNLFGLTTSGASAGTAHTHTLPFQNPTATHSHAL